MCVGMRLTILSVPVTLDVLRERIKLSLTNTEYVLHESRCLIHAIGPF